MKNNKLFKTLSILALVAVVLLITAQSGICETETATQATNALATAEPDKDSMISKLIIAGAGVIISSLVIWIGGTIYNKFFVDKSLFPSNNPDDALNTPKTVQEAVVGFIKRNKL